MNADSGMTRTELMPSIIAVMAKRKLKNGIESLDDFNLEERSKEFLGLPISIANGIMVFFYSVTKVLGEVSQLYSSPHENLIVPKVREAESIIKQQVGQGWLMNYVISILHNYLKSIEQQSSKHFTSMPPK